MTREERLSNLRHDLKKDLRSFKFIFDAVAGNEEQSDPKMISDATLILSQLKANWGEFLTTIKSENKL